MEILHAIVLGIVQGLSEFLPISSSGHLELTRWLFGWDALDEDLETAFDVAVHLGTLVGAIAYLRRDVVMYVTAGFGPLRGRPLGTDGKVAWFLVASAVPAGIAGVVLGATLTVSRFLGYERDAAARLVFLMSLPIIAGAGVFALADASIPSDFWPPFLWGMAASALTGYVAVWGTLKLVRSRTFAPFVVYRIVVGVAVLLILTTGWR